MKTARRGKIAKLPREIREQLNRRLDDGEGGEPLLDWLNGLPEVRAVLGAEFAGQAVNHTNLSQWRKGGYREWTEHQEALAEVERYVEEAGEMDIVKTGGVSDRMALWVTSRYALAAKRLRREGGSEEADWKLLRELSHDLVALRRGDHGAGWLRLEEKRLDGEIKERQRKPEEEFWKWAADPEIRQEICRGFLTYEERLEMVRKAMFGDIDRLALQRHDPVPGEEREEEAVSYDI